MKKMSLKTISIVFALILGITLFTACGNNNTGAQEETPAPAPAEPAPAPATPTESEPSVDYSGDITTAGSTSVQPLSQELADAFNDLYPNVIIDVQGGGSGQGVKAVEADLVDFGALSRELKDEEKEIVKSEYVIAKDGIAVVVNKDVGIDDLSKEQIQGIFTGTITNWSAVGGASAKIEVVAREEGSGTRDAFNELTGVLGKDADGNNVDNTIETALIQGSTGAVKTTVANTENSIGYISEGAIDDSIKVLLVEGVAISAATVLDGSYVISRPFIYITGRELSPQAQAFLDFIFSAEGQNVVKDSGFISVK